MINKLCRHYKSKLNKSGYVTSFCEREEKFLVGTNDCRKCEKDDGKLEILKHQDKFGIV